MNHEIDRAFEYLLNCSKTGLAHSYDELSMKWVKPYPEVTGYLVSYFSSHKYEHDLEPHIRKMIKVLLLRQETCGGWKSFEGNAVLFFDTVQILKGLFDSGFWKSDYRVKSAIQRGVQFLDSQTTSSGLVFPIYLAHLNAMSAKNNSWSDGFSGINSKVLELLYSDGFSEIYPQSMYLRERILGWSLEIPQIDFTHPGAYQLEGLFAAGQIDLVRERIMKVFLPTLRQNGFIPYRSDLGYAYTSGSAQLGILMAKTGLTEEAKSIHSYLQKLISMSPSGGLVQYSNSEGDHDTSIHGESNSWGTKYFLELNHVLGK